MMISKARIKWIKSLELRKFRQRHSAFVAEGPKLLGELLPYSTPLYVAATEAWLEENRHLVEHVAEVDVISETELERVSLLRTPQSVLAVMPIVENKLEKECLRSGLTLALDGVQDPGNLGTIVRIANWFGIQRIICSEGTADVYNPKCIQACMGALAHVQVHYCHLPELLQSVDVPLFGTFLDGTNIYEEPLSADGIIIMGNEGNGVSQEVAQLVDRRLFVPNYPIGSLTTESLNVGVATGIVCAEFRRRQQQ